MASAADFDRLRDFASVESSYRLPSRTFLREEYRQNEHERHEKLPYIVLKDPSGRKLDTYTHLQEAIYRARQNIRQTREALNADEWRLPHAPPPARPDYSRAPPPISRTRERLRGDIHHLSKSTRTSATRIVEVDVDDVAFVAQSLQNLPNIPSLSFLRQEILSGPKNYFQIVQTMLLHKRFMKQTDKRDAIYNFPGFCSGCRRAGLCYGCEHSMIPHYHHDRLMKTGGGFTYFKKNYPEHQYPGRHPLNWKLQFPELALKSVMEAHEKGELGTLSEDAENIEHDDTCLIKNLIEEKVGLPDININKSGMMKTGTLGSRESDDKYDDEGIVADGKSLDDKLSRNYHRSARMSGTSGQGSEQSGDGFQGDCYQGYEHEQFQKGGSRISHTLDLRPHENDEDQFSYDENEMAERMGRTSVGLTDNGDQDEDQDVEQSEGMDTDAGEGNEQYQDFTSSEDNQEGIGAHVSRSRKRSSSTDSRHGQGRQLLTGQGKRDGSVTTKSSSPYSRKYDRLYQGKAYSPGSPSGSPSSSKRRLYKDGDSEEELYRTPPAFKLKKSNRKKIQASSPFSSKRDYNLDLNKKFEVKKSDRKATQFQEFKSKGGDWKPPPKFELKETEKKDMTFWKPPKKKDQDMNKKRRPRKTGGSPDSGLDSEKLQAKREESWMTNHTWSSSGYGSVNRNIRPNTQDSGLGSRPMTRQRMPMFTRKFTGQSPSENEQKFETIASHKTGGITPVYDSDCSQGKDTRNEPNARRHYLKKHITVQLPQVSQEEAELGSSSDEVELEDCYGEMGPHDLDWNKSLTLMEPDLGLETMDQLDPFVIPSEMNPRLKLKRRKKLRSMSDQEDRGKVVNRTKSQGDEKKNHFLERTIHETKRANDILNDEYTKCIFKKDEIVDIEEEILNEGDDSLDCNEMLPRHQKVDLREHNDNKDWKGRSLENLVGKKGETKIVCLDDEIQNVERYGRLRYKHCGDGSPEEFGNGERRRRHTKPKGENADVEYHLEMGQDHVKGKDGNRQDDFEEEMINKKFEDLHALRKWTLSKKRSNGNCDVYVDKRSAGKESSDKGEHVERSDKQINYIDKEIDHEKSTRNKILGEEGEKRKNNKYYHEIGNENSKEIRRRHRRRKENFGTQEGSALQDKDYNEIDGERQRRLLRRKKNLDEVEKREGRRLSRHSGERRRMIKNDKELERRTKKALQEYIFDDTKNNELKMTTREELERRTQGSLQEYLVDDTEANELERRTTGSLQEYLVNDIETMELERRTQEALQEYLIDDTETENEQDIEVTRTLQEDSNEVKVIENEMEDIDLNKDEVKLEDYKGSVEPNLEENTECSDDKVVNRLEKMDVPCSVPINYDDFTEVYDGLYQLDSDQYYPLPVDHTRIYSKKCVKKKHLKPTRQNRIVDHSNLSSAQQVTLPNRQVTSNKKGKKQSNEEFPSSDCPVETGTRQELRAKGRDQMLKKNQKFKRLNKSFHCKKQVMKNKLKIEANNVSDEEIDFNKLPSIHETLSKLLPKDKLHLLKDVKGKEFIENIEEQIDEHVENHDGSKKMFPSSNPSIRPRSASTECLKVPYSRRLRRTSSLSNIDEFLTQTVLDFDISKIDLPKIAVEVTPCLICCLPSPELNHVCLPKFKQRFKPKKTKDPNKKIKHGGIGVREPRNQIDATAEITMATEHDGSLSLNASPVPSQGDNGKDKVAEMDERVLTPSSQRISTPPDSLQPTPTPLRLPTPEFTVGRAGSLEPVRTPSPVVEKPKRVIQKKQFVRKEVERKPPTPIARSCTPQTPLPEEPEPETAIETPEVEEDTTPIKLPELVRLDTPPLPDIVEHKKETNKKGPNRTAILPVPKLKEAPKSPVQKKKRPTMPRSTHKRRSKQPAEAPVTKEEVKEMRDPLDFLAKYCIVSKDRLPFYERIYSNIIEGQPMKYERQPVLSPRTGMPISKDDTSNHEVGWEAHQLNMFHDIVTITRGRDVTKPGMNAPEQYVEKLAYTLEILDKKQRQITEDLHVLQSKKISQIAEMAKQMIPEISRVNYQPKVSKKGKKKKKKKKGKATDDFDDEDEPPQVPLRPEDITDEVIAMRLDESSYKKICKKGEIPQIELEMQRCAEKLANIDDRLMELEGEKNLLGLYCMEVFFNEQNDNRQPIEFRRQQSALYRHLHPDPDIEMNIEELEGALQVVNHNLISDSEFDYLYQILNLPGRRKINFQLFTIIAALSEKISQMDPVIKKLLIKDNLEETKKKRRSYEALDLKMETSKELFALLADGDYETNNNGNAKASQLAVELAAGGLDPEHVGYVLSKFNRFGTGYIDFLDFVTYVPLFIEIHQKIVDDPFNVSLDV